MKWINKLIASFFKCERIKIEPLGYGGINHVQCCKKSVEKIDGKWVCEYHKNDYIKMNGLNEKQ